MGLKSILGAFVEFDEKPEAAPDEGEADASDDASDVKPSKPAGAKTPVRRYAPTTGEVDERYVKSLADLVGKSTVAGYEEFTGQLEALAEDIPDEARRYNAALKSAARAHGNLDKAAVVAAVKDRLSILEKYATQFNEEVDAEEKQKVGGAEADLAAVEAQIVELQQSRDAMRSELAANKSKYQTKREKFAGALGALRTKLASELEKVTTYLKG